MVYVIIFAVLSVLTVAGYIFMLVRGGDWGEREAEILSVNVFSLAALIFVSWQVLSGGVLVRYGLRLNIWAEKLWGPWLNFFMTAVTNIAAPEIFSAIILVFVLCLWFWGKKRAAVETLLAAAGAFVSADYVLKNLFSVARPAVSLVSEASFFLSHGHTTMAAVLFISVFLVLDPLVGKRSRKIFFGVLMVFLAFLIGWSRIYLGAHWLADVLAGFALGIFWATYSRLIILSFHTEKNSPA